MQKTKFQIKGMHCNSCALLIEEKLKGKPGIITAKIGYDSQKGVVAYDESKISASEISGAIKGMGEYEIKAVEDDVEPHKTRQKQPEQARQSNLSIPASIIAAGCIIALAVIASGYLKNSTVQKAANIGQFNEKLPANNEDGQEVAQFNIIADDHIRGDFNAPITLVEFSDFECPFCERHYPTLSKILNDYKGKVRLVYKHFPLGFHPNAQKAAEASECSDEQGKFWEYHDKLFENQPGGYSLEKFQQWAKELGLNPSKFNDCLNSGKYAQKVQDDYKEGSQKNVQGTPATFVNGRLVSGAVSYETFQQVIDQTLTQ